MFGGGGEIMIKKSNNYYPTYWSGCNPIHPVKDWDYVDKLVKDSISGSKITPILIDGRLHNGNLLAGTHRSAANDVMLEDLNDNDHLIPCVYLDDIQYNNIDLYNRLINACNSDDYSEIDYIWDKSGSGWEYYYGKK